MPQHAKLGSEPTSDSQTGDVGASRRAMLRTGAGLGAATRAMIGGSDAATATESSRPGGWHAPYTVKTSGGGRVATGDGTEIFYKDWGSGQPIVFSHGWPLQADVWDDQMMFLGMHGYRTIAHDRRGHGRSTQSWEGNNLDTYADDLAAVIDALDLHDAVLVGHSTGGGEVTRYIGRHGTARVSRVVLIGAIPPLMLKTPSNPGGLPLSVFDGIRMGVTTDRSQFYEDLSAPFYGANRPGSTISKGVRDSFWLWSMQAGTKGAYDCIKAFSETDLTEDLKKIDRPTLIIHGSDDQIVPIDDSAILSHKIVAGSVLKIYPGAPHGLFATNKDQLNADLLTFVAQN